MADISSIAGTTGTTTTTNSNSVLGKDDFMKLLIAQMQNQDPLEPMENTEFAAQLAQFTSLEQLTNLNENITDSINTNYLLTQSVSNTMTAALIGKEVKLDTDSIPVVGQSSVGIGVNLPSDAKTVTIKIYNEYGTLVKEIADENLSSGDNKLSWDCTDNNGNKIANGTYTYKVEATSGTGSDMTVSSFIWGTIDSVKFTTDGTRLVVGGTEYLLSDISEIFNTPTN